MATRKRGGQPNNQNALRHGFYSRNFMQEESNDLDGMTDDGLASEIVLFRVLIRRMFEYAAGNEQKLATTFEELGDAMVKLAGMLRTQQMLTGENTSMTSALSAALNEVVQDLGCK